MAHDVAHQLEDISGAQYFGRGIEAGVVRTSERAVYWYLSVREEDARRADRADPSAFVATMTQGFDGALRAITNATRPDELRIDELFDIQVLPDIVSPHVSGPYADRCPEGAIWSVPPAR